MSLHACMLYYTSILYISTIHLCCTYFYYTSMLYISTIHLFCTYLLYIYAVHIYSISMLYISTLYLCCTYLLYIYAVHIYSTSMLSTLHLCCIYLWLETASVTTKTSYPAPIRSSVDWRTHTWASIPHKITCFLPYDNDDVIG